MGLDDQTGLKYWRIFGSGVFLGLASQHHGLAMWVLATYSGLFMLFPMERLLDEKDDR